MILEGTQNPWQTLQKTSWCQPPQPHAQMKTLDLKPSDELQNNACYNLIITPKKHTYQILYNINLQEIVTVELYKWLSGNKQIH